MLSLPPSVRIWLSAEPADMRKGFDGLSAIVRSHWEADPFSGHLFVFISRRADRLKAIWWDRGGFAMYYKRLERGRFTRPVIDEGATRVELEAGEMAMLLDGLDLRRVTRPKRWTPPTWQPPIHEGIDRSAHP